MDQSCLICAEDFNAKKHQPIACEFCEFTACSTCCQHYVLDQETSICMNNDCKKEWTRKFVVNTFNKTWVSKDWKDMNAKVAVDKEKALIPGTMGVVANIKAKEAAKAEITQIQQQLDTLIALKNTLERQVRNGDIVAEKVVSNGRKCPDSECRGYLSTQWKCGLCEKWACPECHVIKGDTRDTEHTCDPDTLATAKLLDKDTKPCPKCSTPIHKIEGCDQMWCTQCHTGFSWRRGTIENRVHNPHYYEWQRQNGGGRAPRNVGDFECGRDIGDRNVHNRITRAFDVIKFAYRSRVNPSVEITNAETVEKEKELKETRDKAKSIGDSIFRIIRNTLHLSEVVGPRFRQANEDVNQDARVQYITQKYDDKKFASIIHKNNKAISKKQDIFNVIQLQHQGVTDIIFRIINAISPMNDLIDKKTKNIKGILCGQVIKQIYSLYEEFETLTEYSNNLLREHSKTYQCKWWVIEHLSERQFKTFT
jgi:hypothetical protein